MIVAHPFSRITDFHHKRDSFHMKINTFMKSNSFICETSDVSDSLFSHTHTHTRSHTSHHMKFDSRFLPHQGKTMEDLLRSYISMYEQQIQAFRPRNDMFSWCSQRQQNRLKDWDLNRVIIKTCCKTCWISWWRTLISTPLNNKGLFYSKFIFTTSQDPQTILPYF